MAENTLIIPGQEEPIQRYESPADFLNVEVLHQVSFKGAARGETSEHNFDDAKDGDLLEIEYDDGSVRWLRVDQYREERVAEGDRDAARGRIRLQPERSSSRAARGLFDWLWKGLKVLRISPTEAGARAAAKVAKIHFEDKLDPRPGLYRIESPNRTGSEITSPAELSEGAAHLLLLHGTFSSTAASFGGLEPTAGGGAWGRLRSRYQDRILALEHRTLSESPIKNALDAAKLLPEGARLHMISHSRGGLVGELLSAVDLPEEWIDRYQRKDREYQKYDEPDRKALRALLRFLREKDIRVERFVRVACPSNGTTLGERLDLFLSVLLNLLGRIPAVGDNPIYSFAKATALELISLRNDPRELPGLEAQMPKSPLVALLNLAPAIDSDLAVVAGDLNAEGVGGALFEWATNAFYWDSRHDLVVPTRNMSGGLPREKGFLLALDEGPKVNHFNYFVNPGSAGWVLDGLAADEERRKGFQHVARAIPSERRSIRGPRGISRGEKRPVVFVLPGIMGSRLSRNGDEIWVDMFELAFGGLRKLGVRRGGIAAEGLMGNVYGELIDFLANTHEVRPFPYDWRLSLDNAATQLTTAVEDVLEQTDQPVRFIAHSMGGLVVRMLIARHSKTWQRICEREGARVVMLGTPNRGSFAIPRALVGRERLVRMLALLDVTTPVDKLLGVLARFPGVLDLLPDSQLGEGEYDLFDRATWDRMKNVDDGRWAVPLVSGLEGARNRRKDLTDPISFADRILYVAGRADRTPSGLAIKEDENRVVFLGTPKGDGRVTWDSGRIDDVQTWYMDANHGALPRNEAAFPALEELLTDGNTRRLSQEEPKMRGIQEDFELPAVDLAGFPAEGDLEDAAVGGRAPLRRRDRHELQVSVIHGDLRKRDGRVVLVGHHRSDTIVSAEAALDSEAALDGRLSQRYDLGLYPGEVGTAELILRDHDDEQSGPRGALVVGLGPVGSLTWKQVVTTVSQGVVRYALENEACKGEREERGRLSSLLVGAGEGSLLSIEESVGAVTRGVLDANHRLREEGKAELTIRELEFLELFEDGAIEAAHAIHHLQSSHAQVDEVIQARDYLDTGNGGLRRTRAYQGGEQWWRRISVTVDEARQSIDYSILTDSARTDVLTQAVQRDLIDELSADAKESMKHGAASTTLFQLLVPPDLRQAFREGQKTILQVERETANIPWELLADRAFDAEGREREAQPLAVTAGLMRQFSSDKPAVRRSFAVGRDVLVIGDPLTRVPSFPQLGGALEEAEAVHALFKSHGWAPKLLPKEDWRPILDALFSRPWRVLHIAGHGDLAADPRDSGVVLADGRRLTAREVGCLDPVPEFVFLNCCHLAKMASPKESHVDFPRLAGGISEALMDCGVRAVVAAGWAVNDEAALTFAEALYGKLLKGRRLGDAISGARKQAAAHRGVNTWGAYQCYGDPDFRLEKRGQRSARTKKIVSRRELLDELRNLRDGMGSDGASQLIEEAQRLLGQVPADWQDGEVLATLGEAFRKADHFELAIDAYERAMTREKGDATLHAAEQLANLRVLHAEALPESERDIALDLVDQGISDAKSLLDIAPTSERWSILGSAKKRLAVLSAGPDREKAIADAAKAYWNAYELALGRLEEAEVAYSALNWLAIEYLKQLLAKDNAGLDDNGRKVLLSARESGRKRAELPNAKIWDFAADGDAQLTEALWNGTLADELDSIERSFRAARSHGTPGEFQSVLRQIDVLMKLLEEVPDREDADLLRKLRERIAH